MKTFSPPPIAGYKPVTSEQVEIVNQNKIAEENFLRYLDQLQNDPRTDKRWLAVARTYLEISFMALNRAIMRPGRIRLPDDPPAVEVSATQEKP